MMEFGVGPHVFAVPPGVDFARALVAGLIARLQGQPPESMARVSVYLNTERMRRRMSIRLGIYLRFARKRALHSETAVCNWALMVSSICFFSRIPERMLGWAFSTNL